MGAAVSRESYFEVGLDVLSDLGYGGLKLAEVCHRLEVTTGSFYHYFASWSAYTGSLVAHWVDALTTGLVASARAETDPRRRIERLLREGIALPHGAESAIRVWSSIDPGVRAAQATVDQRRFDVLVEAAADLLGHQRQAEVFASWTLYLLIGYEQSTLPRHYADLEWIARQLLDALDGGRFDSVPDGG